MNASSRSPGLKIKNNLWDLKSSVIGRYNFGESLDVFMEQPVWGKKETKETNKNQTSQLHRRSF